jgi:hypothetical protein
MRFDPLEPPLNAPGAAAAPSSRPRRRPANLAASPHSPLNYRPFPSWARLGPKFPDQAAAAVFAAGAGLALLDAVLAQEPPFAGALRHRLALRAASASAKILRLREDQGALRDAEHLAVSEDAGRAGRLHRWWRRLASEGARFEPEGFGEAVRSLELEEGAELSVLIGQFEQGLAGPADPVAAAAQAAARAYRRNPGPEGEILAAWSADLVLARRLRWSRPIPLLMTTILAPALRRGPHGARPRPSDPEWPQAVAAAYALAAAEAHALAGELGRRAETLLALQPKLRAKAASRVVAQLLADDCVSPARAARSCGLSDRAARRLFDRLLDHGAVRELSGRATFRLYGL